jgi:protocatechuate 3,4-dioxygenase beta subunit
MERLASISGTLRDSSGKPIAKSRVTARRAQQANLRPTAIEDESDVTSGIALPPVPDMADIDVGEDVPFGIDEEYDSRPRAGLAITDENGAFVIEGVRPGAVVVRANGAHRPVERAGLQVSPAQKLENLALIADIGSTALITVTDEKGKPVRDAKVVLEAPRPAQQGGNGMTFSRAVRIGGGDGDGNVVSFGDTAKVLGRGVTGEDGIARIPGLSAGAAVARSLHPQFAPSSAVDVSLPAQGEAKAHLTLRTPGVARLMVTDARGMPIAADYVVRGPLGTDEQATPFDGRTGTDGTMRVEPLAKGRYTATLRTQLKATKVGSMSIVMSAGGQRSLPQTRVEFEVQGGDEVDVALRMPTLATVRGVVTGTKGPTGDVEVELEPLERAAPPTGIAQGGMELGEIEIPGFGQQSATTDANGAYGIDGVVPGRYSLSWGLRGQPVKDRMEITIADGEVDVVRELRLRHGSLRVLVMGDGEPIEGAEVEVFAAGASDAAPKPRARMVMVSMTVSDDGQGGSSSSSLTMGAESVRTDVDGIAVVENVPPGRYVVRITHPRFAKRELPAQDVIENAQTDCGRVDLDAAGRIRGRVVGADGKPAKMALVTCRKAGDAAAEPDRKPVMNGAFTFTGLAAGRYEVTARALSGGGGADGDPVTVEVQAGKTASDVEVRLPPQ